MVSLTLSNNLSEDDFLLDSAKLFYAMNTAFILFLSLSLDTFLHIRIFINIIIEIVKCVDFITFVTSHNESS